MQLLKFLFFFFFVSGVLALTAIMWPRFMGERPRPGFLVRIHDAVKDTQWGKQAASVLGISDELTVEPLTLQSFAANLVQTAMQTAGNKAQAIITAQAVNQLTGQFDQLPADKQQLLQQIICRPVSYSEATIPAQVE